MLLPCSLAMLWPCSCHALAMLLPWQEHGKSMARAWQEHGKSMARARQEHGKSMARAWQDHHAAQTLVSPLPKVASRLCVAMPPCKRASVQAATGSTPQKASKTTGQPDASITNAALAAAQGRGPPPPRPATEENVQEVEAYINKLAVWVQRMVEEAVKTKAPGLRATDLENKSPHYFGALPIRAVGD